MGDPRDQVELSSRPEAAGGGASGGQAGPFERAGTGGYLRLWFDCSKQYARAQKSLDGKSYTGRCPSCGKTMRFVVGAGGTQQRFFRVSC